MRNSLAIIVVTICFGAFATAAHGGTAFMDFDSGVGVLNYNVSGPGTLTTSDDRAYFTGAGVTVLGQGGTPVSCGGTNTIQMTIHPYVDAGSGVGIILINPNNTDEYATAIVSSDGIVTLTDYIGNWQNVQFDYPNASNNFLTVTDDRAGDQTTLSINATGVPADTVTLYNSLNGAVGAYIGVVSLGVGGFADLTASGPNVPDHPVDSDGDGVSDVDEDAAGTDAEDPGSLPVFNSSGAEITGLDGATLSIPAGSLPEENIVVTLSTPESVPEGSIPGGSVSSGIARDLAPNGTDFSSPVTVSIPYTDEGVAHIDEPTLQAFWYDGADYSSSGITSTSVDTGNNTVTFDTTHFTVFLLAGAPGDSDGDGLSDYDETRDLDLETAGVQNPFDAEDPDSTGDDGYVGSDGVPDGQNDWDDDSMSNRDEFVFGYNPTDPDSWTELPLFTLVGCSVLALSLLGAGLLALRARRRSAGRILS